VFEFLVTGVGTGVLDAAGGAVAGAGALGDVSDIILMWCFKI